MPIDFNCPECGHHYRVADAHAGKRTMCKGCGARIQVPGQKVSPQPGVPAHPLAQQPASQPTAASRPYGRTVSEADKPLKRRLNIVLIAAVVLALLGMALPWVMIPDDSPAEMRAEWGSSISGFGLPFVINGTMNKMRAEIENQMRGRGIPQKDIDVQLSSLDVAMGAVRSLYALFLIPILALLTLGDELSAARKGKNRWWLRIVNTLSPVIAFVVIFAAFTHLSGLLGGPSYEASGSNSDGTFDDIGVGFWIVCLATLVSFVSIFTSPKPKTDEAAVAFTPSPRPTPPRPGAGGRAVGNRPPLGAKPKLPGRPNLPRPK